MPTPLSRVLAVDPRRPEIYWPDPDQVSGAGGGLGRWAWAWAWATALPGVGVCGQGIGNACCGLHPVRAWVLGTHPHGHPPPAPGTQLQPPHAAAVRVVEQQVRVLLHAAGLGFDLE